jgi:hypothetical protein
MGLGEVEGQLPVGHDLVEVLHEIVLGHRRQFRQGRLVDLLRIDTGEASAVPSRPFGRQLEETTQGSPAVGGEPVGGPVQPLHHLGGQGHDLGDMVPSDLLFGHDPTLSKRSGGSIRTCSDSGYGRGWRRSLLSEVEFCRPSDEFELRLDAELGVDPGEVRFDGALADEEALADLTG